MILRSLSLCVFLLLFCRLGICLCTDDLPVEIGDDERSIPPKPPYVCFVDLPTTYFPCRNFQPFPPAGSCPNAGNAAACVGNEITHNPGAQNIEQNDQKILGPKDPATPGVRGGKYKNYFCVKYTPCVWSPISMQCAPDRQMERFDGPKYYGDDRAMAAACKLIYDETEPIFETTSSGESTAETQSGGLEFHIE